MRDELTEVCKACVAQLAFVAVITPFIARLSQKLKLIILVFSHVSSEDLLTDESVRTFFAGKLQVFVGDFSLHESHFLRMDRFQMSLQILI